MDISHLRQELGRPGSPTRRRRRLAPRSLRWRLTLAVGAVLVLAFVATFIVVYREADARLHAGIDGDLRGAVAAFSRRVAPPGFAWTAAELEAAADVYVTTQPFSTASRLLYAVVDGHVYSNEPAVFNRSSADSDDPPSGARREIRLATRLIDEPPGISTRRAPDVGALRLLVQSVRGAPGVRATIAVGEPLAPVDDALEGILRGFAIGGTLTLAGALLVGFLLAASFARPLHRMARIAARVDAGDLSPRIAADDSADETRILGDAFNHMLDRLEDAFARQQAFISDASHELRTPLTAIRGQLEVLGRNDHPAVTEVRRVARLVQAEVDRMTRLTEDLLLLAHTDEAREVEHEAIELEPLLDDLLAGIRPTADRRFALAGEASGTVSADRDRITQALRNLLRNAIEHTQPGGRIELGTHEVDGASVQIWVDDDGPGIPPHERDRVFNRFHRADRARARTTGGTGLGLAIVLAIVTAHGGRAWATRAPLGGARIVIELPGYAAAPDVHRDRPTATHGATARSFHQRGNRR